MPRRRASLWPSKVKFTSSMPRRSAASPNAASAPPAAPLNRTQSSVFTATPSAREGGNDAPSGSAPPVGRGRLSLGGSERPRALDHVGVDRVDLVLPQQRGE